MISPYTKPGTKIVCVNDDPIGFNIPHPLGYITEMDGLLRGTIYTVRTIAPRRLAKSGFVAVLVEIRRTGPGSGGFDIGRFRYLHLPGCLTKLLETAPVRAPSELEPTQ